VECHVELLERNADSDRFGANTVLRHIETHFARPRPAAWGKALDSGESGSQRKPWDTPEFDFETPDWRQALAVYSCTGLEAEAVAAAREIWRHILSGGRFREIAVLCRTLDAAAPIYRRVFRRYQIPCFIDQRALVSHHPLAELTRGVLRTLTFGWQSEDWFAVVKSGLVRLADWEADRLENEALARGWGAAFWQSGVPAAGNPQMERLRVQLSQPLFELRDSLGSCPTGASLATGLRELWRSFGVDQTLCQWDAEELESGRAGSDSGTRHATIGRQLDQWLSEVARAFQEESLPLAQWIPILESALGGLTVGLVPPSLDQVLLGAIDRSRNPDLRLVILPGWNDGVFPARPGHPTLLSEADREVLALAGVGLGPLPLARLGHERFYAYIALTRARERVVITHSSVDGQGKSLSPSPFLTHLRKLFPELQPIVFEEESVRGELPPTAARTLDKVPPLGSERLDPAIARRLYGTTLQSSVSRLEQFASCPFQHFAGSALRLGERKLYELDARERGSFQHEVLARFHQSLVKDGPGWRAITEGEARLRLREISAQVAAEFRRGLSHHSGSNRFATQHMTRQLEGLVVELLRWLPSYGFDPEYVELAFSPRKAALPPWTLDLGESLQLSLEGKMDRVDLTPMQPGEPRTALVFDYKSSKHTLDPLLLEHGIQMQLPVYLAALQALGLPDGSPVRPGGVAYLSLKPSTKRVKNRADTEGDSADEASFRHDIRGRFDLDIHTLLLPTGTPTPQTPFKAKVKKDGQPYKSSDLQPTAEFASCVKRIPEMLEGLGRRILQGEVHVAPYQDPKGQTPCERCQFDGVCRIEPDRFDFRRLPKPQGEEPF
jgi:ATP-dependent helicase/nuclease subunit B